MSDSDDEIPEAEERSMPGWVMTFADLMSLLMCFFVLLLSFSEMDLKKFKQVAGSMEKAFGIQRDLKVMAIPRGTSIIAQEFSPGRPEPTPLNEIRQSTTNELEDMLKIEATEVAASAEGHAQSISKEMIREIKAGMVEMEAKDNRIVIRILEKGSFASGSATLRTEFLPVIDKISKVLEVTAGQVTVAGFTDDIPIETALFRSNWELSASRAFAVITELLKNEGLDSRRFILSGYAANRPLVPNDTPENRAKNRRVELIILQGEEHEIEENEVIKIEKDADTKLIPNIEDIEEEVEPTFPPMLEITSDGSEDYSSEGGDLGIFEEDALYDYQLEEGLEEGLEEIPQGEIEDGDNL